MRTDNRQIRLTEQDLHFIVENAVNNILMENMEDEGVGQFFTNVKNAASAWNGNRKIQNAINKIRKDLSYLDTMAQSYGLNSLDKAIQTFDKQLTSLSTQAMNNKDIQKANMWDLRTQQQKDQYNQLTTPKPNGRVRNPKVSTPKSKAENSTPVTQGKQDVNPNKTGTLPGTNGTNMHYVQPPSGEVTNNGGFNPYYGQTNLYANNNTNK